MLTPETLTYYLMINQSENCAQPKTPLTTFSLKTLPWDPLGSWGLLRMSHPVLLAWPCNKSFSAPKLVKFQPHCPSGTQTWIWQQLYCPSHSSTQHSPWGDFLRTYPQNHLQLSSKQGQGNLSTVHGCKFKPIRKESQFFRIQVHPKGNQPWIFTGRTDAEVDTPILWPRDAKSWLIGKDPDAGKDWRQEEKGTTEDGWMASLTKWTCIWASPRRWWRTGSLVCCSLWGHKESDTTERLSNKGLGAQEQKKRGVFMTRVSFSLWGKAKD